MSCLRHCDVDACGAWFRPAVHGIMFGRGDHAVILRIVALQSGDECHAHAAGQEGIFAVGFLAAAPAWIAKNVDVGRPEIQAFHDVAPSGAHGLIVLGAAFGADDDRHLMNQRGIKCRSQPDGLRKYSGGASIGDAVQSLTPPVICGNLQPRNRARLVHQL